MLIEIHMLQNHSPANLNRDDLNAPKTCIFGGVIRARISSQCLKRSIRRSPLFTSAMEKYGAVQTRSLIREIAIRAAGSPQPPEKLLDRIRKVFEAGGVPIESSGGDPTASKVIWVLPNSAIAAMAETVQTAGDGLAQTFAGILEKSAIVPDIALAGRMLEFDAKGAFDGLCTKMRVEAALQVAHAISTHAVVNEVDYFTAAEDLPYARGAAHPDESMYASACFYKYFSLDWDQLVDNLSGPRPADPESARKWDAESRPHAVRLAAATVGHFIRAAAMTTPSGKQNSFAAHNEPCGILVEIKKNGEPPTSYANAFAEPVERIGKPDDDAPDEVSIQGRSVACLADHVYHVRKAYGINSTLLWYSPRLWRFPLRCWERDQDGRKTAFKPLVDNPAHRFDVLGGNGAPGLVEAVVENVAGLKWDDVRDVGRAP